ncbi:TPA: Crp/Fnr family transcriptional regulator [Streptococcus suis]
MMKQAFKLTDIDHYPKVAKLLANFPLHLIGEMEYIQYTESGKFYLPQNKIHSYVYIILDGEFEISLKEKHSNRSMLLTIYNQEGTLIGEQEAILDKPYSSTVTNTSPCKLLRLSKQAFCKWVQLDQTFAIHLLKDQCQQVYDLSNQAGYHLLHNAKEQIALFLLNKHRKNSLISKQDVHRAVAISSRHTNRILADLNSKGLISISQSSIQVLKPEELLYYGEE